MSSILALAPLLAVVAGALLVMLLEAFRKREDLEHLGWVSISALLVSAGFSVISWGRGWNYFHGGLVLDDFALVLGLSLAVSAILLVLMSLKYISRQAVQHGEYYALLLLAVAGMMIMTSTKDFLVAFLGLEVLSVSSYVLAGLRKDDQGSSEAAVKYFLMGSFAAAFFVFGLALFYGTTRSLDFSAVVSIPSGAFGPPAMGLMGLGLILVALAFKVAVVPFHMWAPDVFEGAPTPVAALFSVGPKLAGFALIFRVLGEFLRLGGSSRGVFSVLWAVAALTMIVANLAALRQNNLKRLLAYSTIAHSGYLLVGLLSGDGAALSFYFIVYLFMNLGAFGVLTAMTGPTTEHLDIEDFAGLGFRYPWLAASLSAFLLSLAGFPPTAGFLAKFYIFGAAVRQGQVLLVVVAVCASLVSVYYYLRVIVFMYMREPSREIAVDTANPALTLVVFLCLYGVLQLGLWPGNLLVLIRQAVASLF